MKITGQIWALVIMIFCGSLVAILFDTYNLFLQRQVQRKYIVFASDIIFWCVQALIVFFVLYIIHDGVIRLYYFVFLIFGAIIYYVFFRSHYLQFLEYTIILANKIKRIVISIIFKLIIKPIQIIGKAIIFLAITAFSIAKKLILIVLLVIGSIFKLIDRSLMWLLRLFLPRSWYKMLVFWREYIKDKYNKWKNKQ